MAESYIKTDTRHGKIILKDTSTIHNLDQRTISFSIQEFLNDSNNFHNYQFLKIDFLFGSYQNSYLIPLYFYTTTNHSSYYLNAFVPICNNTAIRGRLRIELSDSTPNAITIQNISGTADVKNFTIALY